MKKTFVITTILMSLMLMFSISTYADGNGSGNGNSSGNGSGNGTDTVPTTPIGPIDGGKIEIPFKKFDYNRSLNEPIRGYYYITDHVAEIEFNENIGIITISVTNSNGSIIYRMQHDTSTECGCDIFIPFVSDCYYIDITGNNYTGTGYICI